MPAQLAAQYIRMSTDKQDLSPSVQKEAIAAYAAARDMEIVASYEDEGRSGVHLKNRPALLKLLRDVTEAKRFSTVLVYDVSRWGRFQDTDAAAYYEYHCRLHGAAVIYVAEMFGAEVNPITAMLKSMKRAMAAEYSRDLATKCRAGQHLVVSRGYQMGPLPPLGYRRCSVSADGHRRVVLDIGQRKVALTDRIEWVPAAPDEVALVKRIADMYAQTHLSFNDIARVGELEGWLDHQGRPLSGRAIATLLKNEALIGNFVWGRVKHSKSIVTRGPSRHDGSVPRVIDDGTWSLMQQRIALDRGRTRTNDEIAAKLRGALEREPGLATRDLRAQGLPDKKTIRRRLGPWTQCLQQAGLDPNTLHQAVVGRTKERRADGRSLGMALAARLHEQGYAATFNGRMNVLECDGLGLRLRALWPTLSEVGQAWRIRVEKISRDVDFELLVRMEDRFGARDFFVVPPADLFIRFPRLLTTQTPTELARYWCQSHEQLFARIARFTNRE